MLALARVGLLAVVGGIVLGAVALGGCKSVCEKAVDHMAGCMESYCEENAESAQCQRLARGDAAAPECDEGAIQQAQAMMAQGCDQITGGFGAYAAHAGAARRVEATTNVRRLVEGARWYYDTERVTPAGQMLPPQFPASSPRTPPEVPCGEPVAPDSRRWEAPTWSALNFELREPQHYSYQFDSRGVGADATFTASAFGDLDCDGQLSTFVIRGRAGRGQVEVGPLESYSEGE